MKKIIDIVYDIKGVDTLLTSPTHITFKYDYEDYNNTRAVYNSKRFIALEKGIQIQKRVLDNYKKNVSETPKFFNIVRVKKEVIEANLKRLKKQIKIDWLDEKTGYDLTKELEGVRVDTLFENYVVLNDTRPFIKPLYVGNKYVCLNQLLALQKETNKMRGEWIINLLENLQHEEEEETIKDMKVEIAALEIVYKIQKENLERLGKLNDK